jgi:hypothetical protein
MTELAIARPDLQRGKPNGELVDVELEDAGPDSVCRYVAFAGELAYSLGTHAEA